MDSASSSTEPKTLSPEQGLKLAEQLEAAGVREKPAPAPDLSKRLSSKDGAKAWGIAQEVARQRAAVEARTMREATPARPTEPDSPVQTLAVADILKALAEKDRTEREEKKRSIYGQLQEIYGS
ncbi:MAG: hypothetical protein AAB463_00730 [Patescibacteria group bacterium]